MTKNETNINEIILENFKTTSSLFDGTFTKGSLFLREMLGLDFNQYYNNIYIDDGKLKHNFSHPIFLLIDTEKIDNGFRKYDQELRNHRNFNYSYFVGVKNKKFMFMYVFEVSKLYLNDYLKFKKGEYSHFSDILKKKFPQYIKNEKGVSVPSTVHRILNRSPLLKKIIENKIGQELSENAEYWSIPDKREIYRNETIN